MSTIIWIIVAVVAVGIIIYFLKGKGKGEKGPTPPEAPPTAPGGPTA